MTRLLVTMIALAMGAIANVHAEPGQGDAYIGLPHDIELEIGANEVPIFVGGLAECEEGSPAPSPLQVRLTSGSSGPDDGRGPAWAFEQTRWSVAWTAEDGNTYVLNQRLTVNVTGHGHGERGHMGEIAMATQAVQEEACSAQGFTMLAKNSHSHISIGARPAAQDAPAAFAGVLGLLVAAAVARR